MADKRNNVLPTRAVSQEELRLQEDRHRKANWKRWGPYLTEREWGTVREDYSARRHCLGLFPPRPRAQPRLSLGRRRHRRHLRPPPVHLLRAGALERPRSDSEGTALRPDRQRRQSRRGRQGVLLLPRLHADAFLHEVPLQVSAGGVSLRAAGRRKPPPRQARAGVRTARHRRLRRRPLLRRLRRIRQGRRRRHPDPHHASSIADPKPPRCTCCRRSGFATPGPGACDARQPRLQP